MGTRLLIALALAASAQQAWQPLVSGSRELLVGVGFADGRRGFAVGGDAERGRPGTLLRSDDGGETWRAVEVGVERRLYDVHFPTSRVGYVVGLDGALLRTRDGGQAWTVLEAPTAAWLATVWFTSEQRGWVAGSATLLETRDGGEHFESRLERLPAQARGCSFRDLVFVGPERGYLAGTEGVLLRTEDGGQTWLPCTTGVDAWLRSIDFVDEQHGFVGGSGVLLATRDAGHTWQRLPFPREKVNAVLFLDRERGFVATMEGRLRSTLDGGASWSLDLEAAGELSSLCRPASGRLLALGSGGRILRLEVPREARLDPGR